MIWFPNVCIFSYIVQYLKFQFLYVFMHKTDKIIFWHFSIIKLQSLDVGSIFSSFHLIPSHGEKLDRLKFHIGLIAACVLIFMFLLLSVEWGECGRVSALECEDALHVLFAEFVFQGVYSDRYIKFAHFLLNCFILYGNRFGKKIYSGKWLDEVFIG